MPRSPLTETIQRVEGMIAYVQENLSSDEFNLFLDLLVPEPPEVEVKKTRKKRQVKTEKRGLPEASESARCSVEGCGQLSGHPNHDSTYLASHGFQSKASSKRGSKSAPDKVAAGEPDLSPQVAA